MTIADNGGPVGASFREAFYDPFEKATGIKIANVTQAVDPVAMIRVAVDTKAYTVDVHLITPTHRYRLMHPNDYLEPLDLTPADVPGIVPQYLKPNYMGTDVWATVFAYRTDKFDDNGPKTWAEFWDVTTFPTRRALYKSPSVNLEAALMADGVPWDKVYPLDVERAFKSLNRIKPHIDVWWASGAQSTQLLQSGEVDLLTIWSARAQTAIDAGAPGKIVWDSSIASLDGWGVPKGSPQIEATRAFIKFCANSERQAAYTTVMRNGPPIWRPMTASLPTGRHCCQPRRRIEARCCCMTTTGGGRTSPRLSNASTPGRLACRAGVLFLAVFFVFPVLQLLSVSLQDPVTQAFSLAGYRRLFGATVYLRVLQNTFGIAGQTTLLCLVAGYPLAY